MTSFTIDQVAQACRDAFVRLKEDLPPRITERLRVGRVAQRHGTDTRIFEFKAWDAHQPEVLHKNHLNYSFIYDPLCRYHDYWQSRGEPCNLFTRFYMNKHRVYDNAGVVIPALWEEMQKAEKILHGWHSHQNPQIIALMHNFEVNSPQELEEEVYQSFLELIPYWHGIYAAFCDQYGQSLSRQAIRDIIAQRAKYQPTQKVFAQRREEYMRYVPQRLRDLVFARDGHKCLKCGTRDREFHADHILPVAKGGRTVLDNLQTLCSACNLEKGARETTDYRKSRN